MDKNAVVSCPERVGYVKRKNLRTLPHPHTSGQKVGVECSMWSNLALVTLWNVLRFPKTQEMVRRW